MMAEKINVAEKLNIEVIDFGLKKRLVNSLEITLFRIVQELVTNIIKHAVAKNVTINLSLFQKKLTILVEDNGIGFYAKQTALKKGMGLHSIKTRIKHLKGTFKIDTTPNKGTTVIITIPVV